MTNLNEYIGNKIKELRIKKNITQAELGEQLHTTSQTISRYESGKLKTNQDVLFELAEYFKISINEFFPQTIGYTSDLLANEMTNSEVSITKLSIMSDVTVEEIKNICYGNDKLPKPSSLLKIAKALNIEAYELFVSAGYIDEETDADCELYDTGIRYLLIESERKVLCKYMLKYWNEKTKNYLFTYDKVYSTIFNNDKENYTTEEVLSIIKNKPEKIIDLNELSNNLGNNLTLLNKYKGKQIPSSEITGYRMLLREQILKFSVDKTHQDLLLNCEMLNEDHAKILNEQAEYYINKENEDNMK